MKKVLTAMIAGGFVVAFAGAGFACPYHSAEAEHNLKVAMSEQPAEAEQPAMSTHDPTTKLKLETKEETE